MMPKHLKHLMAADSELTMTLVFDDTGILHKAESGKMHRMR